MDSGKEITHAELQRMNTLIFNENEYNNVVRATSMEKNEDQELDDFLLQNDDICLEVTIPVIL